MRSCDETLDLISAALDGALTGEERAALEEHLSNCPACSALFAELDGLHAATAQLEEIPAPIDFTDQVMARIAADPIQERPGSAVPFPSKKRSRIPWKGWAATAAAVVVVVLGVTTLDGRISIDGKNAADNSDAALSMTETATDDASASDGLSPFSAYDPAENDSDFGGFRNSAEGAAPESALSNQAVEKNSEEETQTQDMCDPAADSAPLSPAVYCGVLTLTGEPLPEGLEDYEGLPDPTGKITYVVPSDYFFSCLAQLNDQEGASFTFDDSGEETAEYGLIVVEAP